MFLKVEGSSLHAEKTLSYCLSQPRKTAHVSGSMCGGTGGEKWEVSACSCTMICFICQALLNKLPMHQAGISLVQGGFSLNLSRWECFLVQGSYLMFTLPKGLSQHLCINFINIIPALSTSWSEHTAVPDME